MLVMLFDIQEAVACFEEKLNLICKISGLIGIYIHPTMMLFNFIFNPPTKIYNNEFSRCQTIKVFVR